MARKILLADDSVTAQNMGRKILADAGYEVLTVNNGSAALKRINEIKPDLIVLDVYMPGYSGLEVCQRLKESEETRQIPVLLTVGKLEPFKPDEARRVKADAHIVKPFEASELLSAIATLEDRLVAHANRAKFVTSEGEISTESGEFDSGWKNRLRFPSKKKKKEEPEPDEMGNFREFRKGKKKATTTSTSSTPQAAEPVAVPDIPRDITPEELDALSALAAKLDCPAQEAEKIAALVEKANAPVEAPAVAPPATLAATSEAPSVAEETSAAMVPQEAVVAETKAAETVATATEIAAAQPTQEFEVPAPPAVVEAAGVASVVEIPVQPAEAPSESAATQTPAPAAHDETPKPQEAASLDLVNTASLAEAPAPVDQQDEPMFASAKAEAPVAKAFEVVASSEAKATAAETVAQAEESAKDATTPAAVKAEETKIEEPKAESKIEEPPVAEVEAAVSAGTPTPVAMAPIPEEPEAPAPSDEELAEALRLLTPSPIQGEMTIPSQGTLVAAGQLLAEEAARHASANSRWAAVAVALSPEESALSLEEEMFRSFAATPAVQPATVETASVAESTPANQDAPSAPVEEKAVIATPTVVAEAAATPVAEIAPAAVQDAPAQAEEAQQEPAATFANSAEMQSAADATSAPQVEDSTSSIMQTEPEPVTATQAAGTTETAEAQESTSESGGQDDMAKDGTGKSGKSQWREIHPATGAAPKGDATEAAKQAEAEAPKAMAAAAAAEGAPLPTAASDAGSIANIVDSVLADLRPKIVEEIAKKLAGK